MREVPAQAAVPSLPGVSVAATGSAVCLFWVAEAGAALPASPVLTSPTHCYPEPLALTLCCGTSPPPGIWEEELGCSWAAL